MDIFITEWLQLPIGNGAVRAHPRTKSAIGFGGDSCLRTWSGRHWQNRLLRVSGSGASEIVSRTEESSDN